MAQNAVLLPPSLLATQKPKFLPPASLWSEVFGPTYSTTLGGWWWWWCGGGHTVFSSPCISWESWSCVSLWSGQCCSSLISAIQNKPKAGICSLLRRLYTPHLLSSALCSIFIPYDWVREKWYQLCIYKCKESDCKTNVDNARVLIPIEAHPPLWSRRAGLMNDIRLPASLVSE